MKRVEAASGAKYSTHKEQPRKFEPIAPVGTNYTPIGKPDIGALRKAPGAASGTSTSAPKPVIPAAPRPTQSAYAGGSASFNAPTTGRAPAGAWDDEPQAQPAMTPPPPPPAAARPPVIAAARLVASVMMFYSIPAQFEIDLIIPGYLTCCSSSHIHSIFCSTYETCR